MESYSIMKGREHEETNTIVDVLPTNLPAIESNELRLDNLFLLEEKISRKEPLDVEEQMQLMVLPLTVKGKERKQEMILTAVELAKAMGDRQQRNQVLAGILTFTDKIIDETYRDRVKEEWEMTQIGKMIFDDGFRAGEAKGEERGEIRGEKRGKDRKVVEQSCRKLRKGKTPEVIAEELEEELEMIRSICQTASGFAPDYNCDQVYGAWSSRAEAGI